MEKNSSLATSGKGTYLPKDDRAFLIGFDGVGKYGNDKYSACLDITLGLGGERWQIMEEPHDRANLERVMKWLSGATGLLT